LPLGIFFPFWYNLYREKSGNPDADLDELDELLNGDLKVPSRGPQFPVKDEFKLSSDYQAPSAIKTKYKDPPPRPLTQDLEAPSILNSQVLL
jgi:hypothetical protein